MSADPFRPFETNLDRDNALKLLQAATAGADDGELFLERKRSEMLTFDDGRVKNASFDASEGFGLRAVKGETAGYAHSTTIDEHALKRAVSTARLAVGDGGGTMATGPAGTNKKLYSDEDPMAQASFPAKIDVLREIDEFAVNLEAEPAPAGVMDVVLGPGWPGILLHEAIGHGLEGDFNRKGSSAFSGLMGQQIAAKGVTVLDDGTIPDRRGSITVDDEGTPSAKNVLIDDGVLVGYMQDRQNARLMGVAPTGNGRRESYAHAPMPRMTNTYMLSGDADPAALVADLKDGIYAVGFGGGQVDITNGKFVFSCTEAYRVKNGKVGAPVKGATLIGDGATALKQIRGIGNDMALDPGIGNCGKAGQWVPVGVGQPSLMIGGLTVGGAAA